MKHPFVITGDDNDYVTGSVYKNPSTESNLLISSSSLKSVFGSPQLRTNVVKDFRAFSNALFTKGTITRASQLT